MMMFFNSVILLLWCLVHTASTNRASSPTKFIKLALGVSKASYLPLAEKRFIKNGAIIENPTASLNYVQNRDKIACSLKNWSGKSFESKETEVVMFTDVTQKLVVFGFRGTEPISVDDWTWNFKNTHSSIELDQTVFIVHTGFKERYNFIASWFENEYNKIPSDYTIILTGHSLGGAEATIAAVYAAVKLQRKPDAVITYGSPLVGDETFRDYYNEVVGCERTVRIVTKGDLIPYLPKFLNFVHVCGKEQFSWIFNMFKIHSLYGGYEKGLSKFDINDINYGCDKTVM